VLAVSSVTPSSNFIPKSSHSEYALNYSSSSKYMDFVGSGRLNVVVGGQIFMAAKIFYICEFAWQRGA
jgi:hypothetical protein